MSFNAGQFNTQTFNQPAFNGRPFELAAIEKALRSYLLSSDDLVALCGDPDKVNKVVFRGTAPAGSMFPLCEYAYYASSPRDYSLGAHIRTSTQFTVKGISSEAQGQSETEANAIAGQIDKLMKFGPLTFTPNGLSWQLLSCVPLSPISYEQTISGVQFFHRGYRVGIHVTPIGD